MCLVAEPIIEGVSPKARDGDGDATKQRRHGQ